MEPFFNLANHYSQQSLHKVAYSALPDAPVQPCVEPRRRLRSLIATHRRSTRRPVVAVRQTRFSTEC